MRDKPIYLNIFTFAFPVTAIVSMLHRISGILLFLLLPVFFSLLQDEMIAEEAIFKTSFSPILIWLALSAVVLHLFAGIRHLFMDAGFGEKYSVARFTAYLVLILTIISSLLIGAKLC